MALDHAQLERLLCERLCADVRVHRRHDDVLLLESPFTFPDGDHYPIYLSETPSGGVATPGAGAARTPKRLDIDRGGIRKPLPSDDDCRGSRPDRLLRASSAVEIRTHRFD